MFTVCFSLVSSCSDVVYKCDFKLISTSFFRVEDYIKSGRDKNIVDPDPNQLYTRRKLKKSLDAPDVPVDNRTQRNVSYPTSGWGTSLEKMPLFTRAEMKEHVLRSGKNLGNKDHHSVPTTLRKAKTFLEDEYLHDIVATSDQQCFYFQAKCCHSFRKNDPPHQLKLALCIVKGDVLDSSCTCVAGKVGFCNHISALMLKVCKFALFEAKSTKDLNQEQDENPELACTSQLQKWNKKGSGKNIVPQPVMHVMVRKTKLDEPNSSRGGVKCLLYEARRQPQPDLDGQKAFKAELAEIDSNMGFSHMNREASSVAELIETRFGKTPVGSVLSYQTSFTESNFSVEADLTDVPRIKGATADIAHYPRFPMHVTNEETMVIPRVLTAGEQTVLSGLKVDEEKIHNIESSTREQSASEHWKKERTYRFTASSFQLIARRQRNDSAFAQSLMHPKPFSSKYVAHGIKYEPIALQEYQQYMFN